jgi:hypothetical protein
MFDDINFDMDGASWGVVPDVSNSEPSMQPTTATGNGTGYYVDNTWQNAIFGTLGQALNYAMLRDQQKIAQQTGTMYTGTPVTATPQLQAQMQNSRILLLGAVAIGLAFVLKGK